MDFFVVIFHFLRSSWTSVKSQWKGFAICAVVAASVYFLFLRPVIDKYRDFGQKVGTYQIAKGQDITIAANELSIWFDNLVYCHVRTAESTFCFPSFSIRSLILSRYQTTRYKNFQLGQRLLVDSYYYYYTIELTDLDTQSEDTTATIEVYRKEFPAHLGQGR